VYYIIAIHLANCIIIDDYEISLTFYEPPQEMPSRVKGRIYSARDLPVMDLKSNLTDAYVEVTRREHNLARNHFKKYRIFWNQFLMRHTAV
jgi:hypothetical protein